MSTFKNRDKYPVVIVGGGIHGVSIAYYLSTEFGITPLLIEQTAIACAASGKAAGFLARDWGFAQTADLHLKSYHLHQQLASHLNIESYREIKLLAVNGNREGLNIPSWLDRKVSSALMTAATAQVTPLELTEKLLEAAKAAGTEVLIDKVVQIYQENGEIRAVRCEHHPHEILTDNVVIAMGPWSGVALQDWFRCPLRTIQAVKLTSFLFQGVSEVLTEPFAGCCEPSHGCHLEFYPRPNGDIYVCGCGGSEFIEPNRLRAGGDCAEAGLITADEERVEVSLKVLKSMTSVLDDKSPGVRQACMRPTTADTLPAMGPIPGVKGAYVSSGHNCWGILWAPISGKCMAELIATGRCTEMDLSPFDPARFF